MAEFEEGNPLVTIRERIGKIKQSPDIVDYKNLTHATISELIDNELETDDTLHNIRWSKEMFEGYNITPTSSALSAFELLNMSQILIRKSSVRMLEMGSKEKKLHAALLLDYEKGFNLPLVALLNAQEISRIGPSYEEDLTWGVAVKLDTSITDFRHDFELDPTGRILVRKLVQKIKNPNPSNNYIEKYENRDMIMLGADCAANAYSKLYPLVEQVMVEEPSV